MIQSFKYRIYPNKQQQLKLEKTLRLCRFLYNCGLEERIGCYKKTGKSIRKFDQINYLPEIKDIFPEYKEIYSQVLQDVFVRLDKTYQAFFARIKKGQKAGFPRFQGKDRYDSFTYPQFKLKFNQNKINLPKIGDVKIKLSREILGTVKTATIKKEVDEWYICIASEVESLLLPKTGNSIGLDVGIVHFYTDSNDNVLENSKFLEKSQKKIRKHSRSLVRKKKGSSGRRKTKLLLSKSHRKVRRQRDDFLNSAVKKLVNQYDLIIHEDLNIKGMVKTRLGKAIHEVSWGIFFSKLQSKAEYAGKEVIRVDPKYTSQTCSKCRNVDKASRISQSLYVCLKCKYEGNADHNAALNILGKGLVLRSQRGLTDRAFSQNHATSVV